MKILYHHRIASKDGQYVHLEELTNALKKEGHEIILVGPRIVEQDGFGSEGGIVPYLKQHIPGAIYELMELTYSAYDFIRTIWAVWKFRPDCIYERYNLFFVSGIWVKKLTGLPLLLEVNAPLYAERAKFDGITLNRLARWSERYTWRNADYTLPVTQVLADIVRKESGMDNQVVIHNGINEEAFQEPVDTTGLKQELGIEGKQVLGFTGFVRDWHGIEHVLDLISKHPERNLVLLLVGDGPARQSLEAHAARLGISDRLVITGIIERNQVHEYVALFDIALQPAVTPYASPLKMFEYLAMGKIIVAPADDNIKEILEDGHNALLFDHNEPDAYRDSILQATSLDEQQKIAMQQAARQTIKEKKFTWLDNAHKVTDLFQRLLKK